MGDLLFMGPDDIFPADLTRMKLGREVPRSFINRTCAHCNRGIPVPPAGPIVPYFARKDRAGAYSVLALCTYCSREFFVCWETDPRR